MAPQNNNVRTYGRSNKNRANNSVEAINKLFARNKKAQKKKKKILIKELPLRTGVALLSDESLHVSLGDTFDKVLKSAAFNKVNIKSQISIVNSDSDVTKSIKQVNSVHSPIMTRQRKKTASLKEISLYKLCDNKSDSIPHLNEPTVDRIDFSLEVEKVRPVIATSLSYIKLPTHKGGEVSDNIARDDGSTSKAETSFEPFFSRTFREKQMVHSSTPLIPMRRKERIVNHTISPIRNTTLEKEAKGSMVNADVHTPKNSLTHIMPSRSARKSSRLPNDERLQESSKMLHENVEKNKLNVHSQTSKIESVGYSGINISELSEVKISLPSTCSASIDAASEVSEAEKEPRKNFITLRKRKILIKNDVQVGRRFRKTKDETQSQLSTSSMGDALMEDSTSVESFITASLKDFSNFENKMNGVSTYKSDDNTHNLNDFESFEARNRDLINLTDFTQARKNTSTNFITKRHRRLTDSYLVSVKKTRIPENTSRRSARYLSFHGRRAVKSDGILPQEAVVMLTQIDSRLFTDHKIRPSRNVDVNNQTKDPSMVGNSSDVEQSYENSHIELKNLVVNLTRPAVGLRPFSVIPEKGLGSQYNSVEDQSELLFQNSFATSDCSVNQTPRQPQTSIKRIRRSASVPKEMFLHETRNLYLDNVCQDESRVNVSSLLDENVANNNKNFECGRFNHLADDFEKYYTRVTAQLTFSEDSAIPVINQNDVMVDKVNDSESFPNAIRQSNSLLTICDNTYDRALGRNSGDAVNSVEFQEDKFEESFEHKLDVSEGDFSDTSNENISACNVNRERDIEDSNLMFSVNVTNKSKSPSGRNKSTAATIQNGDKKSHVRNQVNKELVVKLTKFPWPTNVNNSVLGPSSNSPVIDLTDLPDDVKPIIGNRSSNVYSEHNRSSDIIESSVLECNDEDTDGFRIPTMTNFKRRHSKTMLLKAGKLFRRSLSMFKRNSMVLDVINDQACKVTSNGSYCNCSKCRLARTSRRLSSRRYSTRIVPASPIFNSQREASVLENYAHNNSYVSDQILEDNLENSIRSLSLSKRKSSIIQNPAPVTARELVLRRCGQTESQPFEECYPKGMLQNCQKIGEGVYGEVFLFKNPNGGTSVMKVIPIEGGLIVNGERQKKFEEILSEITIALELSNLRNNKQNKTSVFSEVQKIQCVRGAYPTKLLYLWDLYDETRGSENDSPEVFGEDQLYIVLQLANGGLDLEAFIFNNALQAYAMFQQVACALAVAEEELQFEHRDLHWGNVLLSAVDKNSKVTFRLDGKNYEIMTKGVEVAIIDFTLSRIECDGVVIFNDLSLDPDLFTAEGDYQFEIYKLMQKKNGNNWQRFEPYSNVLWLHYTLDKAITALRYKNIQTKVHKEYLGKIKQLKNSLLQYNSVKEFVQSNF